MIAMDDLIALKLRLMEDRELVLTIGLLALGVGMAIIKFAADHPEVLEDKTVSDKINALKALK